MRSTRDSTKGGILFGAVTPGTPADSQFYMEFGGMGFIYVDGYTIAAEPAVSDGPVYAGTDWKLDPALTASTAAGWALIYGAPGEYTFTITHPTLTCGSVDRKIAAGFSTTYVGVPCHPAP